MMTNLKIVATGHTAEGNSANTFALTHGHITDIPGSDSFRVRTLKGSVVSARRAYGCILEPDIHDLVLVYSGSSNDHFILAILQREGSSQTTLSLPDQNAITIQSENLTIRGHSQVSIQSGKSIDIACLENLRINAGSILETARQSLVQLATTHIAKAQNIAFTAKQLFRSHGHHQLISADADVKVDGERINMG